MAEEANIRPGALVKRRRHRRIEADQERFERADHVAQDFEAGAVDGEAQALAGDALVGVDEHQDRIGRADFESRRQTRARQWQAHDFGAQCSYFHAHSPPQARRTVASLHPYHAVVV